MVEYDNHSFAFLRLTQKTVDCRKFFPKSTNVETQTQVSPQ